MTKRLKALIGALFLANAVMLLLTLSPGPAVAGETFCDAEYCVCWEGNTWIPGGCHNNAAEDDQCGENRDCLA